MTGRILGDGKVNLSDQMTLRPRQSNRLTCTVEGSWQHLFRDQSLLGLRALRMVSSGILRCASAILSGMRAIHSLSEMSW